MYLKTLTVEHVRNLVVQTLTPDPHQNLIIGPNGSGKTSLLEAIYLLCVSRSFRTHRVEHVITRGKQKLQVTGTLCDPQRDREIRLGLAKSKGFQAIHVDRRRISRLAELTALCPVVVLNPEAHELLEQGPKQRRQFLDWGLFHVEPDFLPVWQQFYRVLRQRNAALRQASDRGFASAWDREYLKMAERLHDLRARYLARVESSLGHFSQLLLDQEAEFAYRQGWQGGNPLAEALRQQRESDLERGFTHSGPHRADLIVKVSGQPAQAHLSRGQQKLMVCAMRLAQAADLKHQGKDSLLLVDDLPSELDSERRAKLLEAIAQLGMQTFITATDAEALPDNGIPSRMFHVKQGEIQT